MQDEKGDVIIFGYKKQDEIDSRYPGLNKEDFSFVNDQAPERNHR